MLFRERPFRNSHHSRFTLQTLLVKLANSGNSDYLDTLRRYTASLISIDLIRRRG
jgi:hypothetical protein